VPDPRQLLFELDARAHEEIRERYRGFIDELRELRRELQAEVAMLHAVLDRARQLSRARSVREFDPLQ
jgi:hypothetical protein